MITVEYADPIELLDDATLLIIKAAQCLSHDQFRARFASLVANIVGNMAEEDWKKFALVKPCGRPGCTCHENVQKHGMELFKLLRADHQEHCQVRSGAA